MKQYAQGTITDRIAVAANPMYPAYVIRGGEKNLMIDAGINLMGPLYLRSLGEILGGPERLNYLFLTHSHYDHLGSMPYLKRSIPGLAVGGSPLITGLLQKESVLAMMGRLSEIQRGLFAEITGDEDVSLEPVAIDMPLHEGDLIDLGDCACRVLEVPGHTRDSLAYYIPQYGALFPGEAAGVPLGAEEIAVHPEFLSSFDQYLASLKRLVDLRPEILCIGHGLVYTGDDARQFMEASILATTGYRDLIEDYLERAGGDAGRAIEEIVRREYDEKGTMHQERNAYIINLTAQVKEISRMKYGA
ncbi:MAG: MBL fold metallo-hydrolase [Spirochaetes bacterium]|nr:MBL fold metallo-hydrolase [Spirochaetota bacterium]